MPWPDRTRPRTVGGLVAVRRRGRRYRPGMRVPRGVRRVPGTVIGDACMCVTAATTRRPAPLVDGACACTCAPAAAVAAATRRVPVQSPADASASASTATATRKCRRLLRDWGEPAPGRAVLPAKPAPRLRVARAPLVGLLVHESAPRHCIFTRTTIFLYAYFSGPLLF
jgi:hypothetical protein